MKKSTKALSFISALLLVAAMAFAADLTGRVTVRGAPFAGAVVTANMIGANGPATVVVTRTGPDGQYSLHGLRDGRYILLVDINSRRVFQDKISVTGTTFVKNIELY
jgi:hypothetical protein